MKKIIILTMSLVVILLALTISISSCNNVDCKVLDVPQEKIDSTRANGIITNLEMFEFSLPNYKELEDTKDIDEKFFKKYCLVWVEVILHNSEGPEELVLEKSKMEQYTNPVTGEKNEILVFTFSIPHQISLDASEYIPGKTVKNILIRVPHYKNIKNFETNYGVKIYDRETKTQGSAYLPEGIDIRWNENFYG